MATGTVGVLQPGSPDRLIDNENVDDAGTPKYRQRIRIGGALIGELAGCDATNGLDVDVTRVSGNVAVTGTFWQATQPVSIAGTVTIDSELAAAAAMADGFANPTTSVVAAGNLLYNGSSWDRQRSTSALTDAASQGIATAGNYLFNGTTWDRIRGDITNGIDVDVTRVTGTVTVAGTVTCTPSGTQTVDSEMPAAAALADGAANPTTPTLGSATLAWNGTTWDRVRVYAGNGDGANAADLGMLVNTRSLVFNGTTWDRARGGTADALAVTGLQGCSNMLYNGTTWDRMRGDITNGLDVDVTRVSGSVAVTGTFWQATQPVSGTVTCTPSGTQTTKEVRAATPTQASVASSATNVTLLASNANRLGATFFNDSTQVLYLKLGATASNTSYTIQLASNGYYEIPYNYTGIVDGIWVSANGNVRVTEIAA